MGTEGTIHIFRVMGKEVAEVAQHESPGVSSATPAGCQGLRREKILTFLKAVATPKVSS